MPGRRTIHDVPTVDIAGVPLVRHTCYQVFDYPLPNRSILRRLDVCDLLRASRPDLSRGWRPVRRPPLVVATPWRGVWPTSTLGSRPTVPDFTRSAQTTAALTRLTPVCPGPVRYPLRTTPGPGPAWSPGPRSTTTTGPGSGYNPRPGPRTIHPPSVFLLLPPHQTSARAPFSIAENHVSRTAAPTSFHPTATLSPFIDYCSSESVVDIL